MARQGAQKADENCSSVARSPRAPAHGVSARRLGSLEGSDWASASVASALVPVKRPSVAAR